MPENPLRLLPQVSKVLSAATLAEAQKQYPQETLTDAVRAELDILRSRLLAGDVVEEISCVETIAGRVAKRLTAADQPSIRRVINATGIVLHTNLGRAPMQEEAAKAAYEAARSYLNLELDLETGKRSSRQIHVREGICRLTGAESATAVNNCAAATVIVLRALARGKEVIVSRGQLIEIGGSFRIPEIMSVSGATLKEVGTTNITRLADYENAIGPNTGLLMRVHCSNYRVRGFTKSVDISELVSLGRKHNIPVVDDAGSGAAINFAPFGFPGEPTVSAGIQAGADLVLFSGDKLLGGPQGGLIAGKKSYIQMIEKDPLMRAFRLDKMTLAALEATLRLYRDPARAISEIPTLRMLTLSEAQLRIRSEPFAERLRTVPGIASVELLSDQAYAGGGSLPDIAFPTVVIAIRAQARNEEDFASRLRAGSPSVVGRCQGGQFLIDLRTVLDGQEDDLYTAIVNALK